MFLSIYYPLIILKTWYKPSTLIAKMTCQFISVVNIADDKNSILTRKRCCHLSDPVLSVRYDTGSKCLNTHRDNENLKYLLNCRF